ncbi:hypothetical protein [Fundidesulfovibrio butyratiphilus]
MKLFTTLALLLALLSPCAAQCAQHVDLSSLTKYIGKAPFEKVNGQSMLENRKFRTAFRQTVGDTIFHKVMSAGGRYFQCVDDVHADHGILISSMQSLSDPEFRITLFIDPTNGFLDVCWNDSEKGKNFFYMHDGKVLELKDSTCDHCFAVKYPDYQNMVTSSPQSSNGREKPYAGIPRSMTVLRLTRTTHYKGQRKNLLHLTLKNGELDFLFTMGGGPFTASGFVLYKGKRLNLYTEGKTWPEEPGYSQRFVKVTGDDVSIEETEQTGSIFFTPVMIAGMSALKGVLLGADNKPVFQHRVGADTLVRDQPVEPAAHTSAEKADDTYSSSPQQTPSRPGSVSRGLPIPRYISRPDGTHGF